MQVSIVTNLLLPLALAIIMLGLGLSLTAVNSALGPPWRPSGRDYRVSLR
jgi:predicted Na+-dependent transporter